MPTTANSITYFVAADGTLRDSQQGSIAQTPRINYGTDYAVTLSFPPSTIAEGDQLQVALNRTRTFFSSASATGDAPVAAVVKHDVTAEEAAAQAVTLTLSTNTRAMIDQVNGIDHPVRGFFGVHILRGQSFVTLAVADALMMSLESGPDAISPSLPILDYPTRQEAEALAERSENAAERAEEAAAGIVPPLQLSAPPTTSTSGSVGQLAVWHDSDNNKDHLYHLCFVSEGESATLYHWEECVLVSQGNVAGGYPVLDGNGKVASGQLSINVANGLAGLNDSGKLPKSVYATNVNLGVDVNNFGQLALTDISAYIIDTRPSAITRAINQRWLDYAVRSVLPLVTEIPAATSDYSLVDSSATTNNHSHVYSHAPTTAPTYRLPQVTNTAIAHYIELTVDFTNVQTYSFLDYQGEPIVPLFTPAIAAGDVYTFKMEYSAIKAAWLIYPQKQGAVADDFVMRVEVGAANGVAGLDGNAKVPSTQLPYATSNNSTSAAGVVYNVPNDRFNGLPYFESGKLKLPIPNATGIAQRKSLGTQYGGLIHTGNLNAAVTAAITDANHITLTDAQKATAQSVFGVGGPITTIPAATSAYTLAEGIFTHAPTSAPTYTLPNITDDIRIHEVVLIIDFSSVQTFSFLVDGGGDVTFQSYANPTTGDVWAFRCWWYGGKWRIAPTKIKNCVTRQLTNGSLAITDAVGGNALALKMVAPRSVVVNQLVENGNFSDDESAYWYTNSEGVTVSKASNVLTTTTIGTAQFGLLRSSGHILKCVVGHTYLFTFKYRIRSAGATQLGVNITQGMAKNFTGYTVNTWTAGEIVGTATTSQGWNQITLAGAIAADDAFDMSSMMMVDLTQYFNGDQTLIDSIQTWDDLVAYDPSFASYVEYNTGEVKGVVPAVSVDNGTAIASPNELFAVGNAADEYEAVSGRTEKAFKQVDLSSLTWTAGEGTYSATIADIKPSTQNILLPNGYAGTVSGTTLTITASATPSGTAIYESVTHATSITTPTQISLQAGSNTAMQTDGGRLAPIDITYESDEL